MPTDTDSAVSDIELDDSLPVDEAVDTDPDVEGESNVEDEGLAASDSEDIEVEDTDTAERFTVTVDGEELEVTLDDMRSGYMRQADYSRKTQSLAEDRKRFAAYEALDQALQRDPQGTLAMLQERFGASPAGNQEMEDLDPLEREVRELRQWREQEEAKARQTAIERELEGLKVTYEDPDLNGEELLSFAISKNIVDLDVAYRAMKFEERAKTRVAEQEQVRTQKVAAKRKASAVEGGASKRTSKAVTPGDSQVMSIREAVRLAMQS